MVKGIEEAVAKLRVDPGHPVTAEVDGLILEVRYKGRRTTADLFRDIEPLDDTSAEEMQRAVRESPQIAQPRQPGGWEGQVRISEDFDAPLPPEIQDAFEGR